MCLLHTAYFTWVSTANAAASNDPAGNLGRGASGKQQLGPTAKPKVNPAATARHIDSIDRVKVPSHGLRPPRALQSTGVPRRESGGAQSQATISAEGMYLDTQNVARSSSSKHGPQAAASSALENCWA